MPIFAVFDPIAAGYAKSFSTTTPLAKNAKIWKRLPWAVEFASLHNSSRNLPPGVSTPSKHYSIRPNMVVHELDANWQVLRVITAPPIYITLNM